MGLSVVVILFVGDTVVDATGITVICIVATAEFASAVSRSMAYSYFEVQSNE